MNEHQKVKISDDIYELWITRAIIFHLETKDIYFEKDNTAFSEEIEIKRGHDLVNEFPKKNAQFKKIVALGNLIQRIYHNDIRNMLP